MDAPAEPSYRRLPGRTPWFRFGGMSAPSTTLWLGPDHLLKVERGATRESYKRFFYRDIQAVVIQGASRGSSVSIFDIAVIVVIFLVTGAVSQFSLTAAITGAILASPFVLGFGVNLALGPTSQALLVTAVGTEPLSCFSRLGRSAEALRLLAEEVGKVQGEVSTAQLATKWPAGTATPPSN
jgi:hypothetical protein